MGRAQHLPPSAFVKLHAALAFFKLSVRRLLLLPLLPLLLLLFLVLVLVLVLVVVVVLVLVVVVVVVVCRLCCCCCCCWSQLEGGWGGGRSTRNWWHLSGHLLLFSSMGLYYGTRSSCF